MKLVKIFVSVAFLFTFVMIFSTIFTHASSKNLLLNPGGNEGMNYWIDSDDVWDIDDKTVKPYNGVYFWPKKKGISTTMIYQDVTISNYVGQKLTLSAYTRDYTATHGDESVIRLELLDSNGTILSKKEASNKNNDQWQELKVSEIVPGNAVTARVSLVGIRHSGSDLDAYFDETMLTIDSNTGSLPTTPSEPAPTNQGELSYLRLKLRKGQKAYLGAVITGNAGGMKILWSSTQSKVASVNQKGVVTAKSKGSTIVNLKLGNSELKIKIKVIN